MTQRVTEGAIVMVQGFEFDLHDCIGVIGRV
jgi:hypothetical protein